MMMIFYALNRNTICVSKWNIVFGWSSYAAGIDSIELEIESYSTEQ